MNDREGMQVDWALLDACFGRTHLARLAHAPIGTLARMEANREVDWVVWPRLAYLTHVTRLLSGSYTNEGVSRWFDRNRIALGGADSPNSLLV